MKLTMLGTGNALVTECYNTCFVIEDEGKYFMVDGGGGSTVLHQLKHAGFLAVQKANYAVRMYEKVGFITVNENEEEFIMVCKL